MQASTGVLCVQDEMFSSFGISYSAAEEHPTEEDYYGGIESEHNAMDCESDSDLEEDGCGSDVEKHPETIIQHDDPVDDYVLQFDDTISKEDFNSGRDYISDPIDHGIDDTEMTDPDGETDADIGFIEPGRLEYAGDISVQGDVEINGCRGQDLVLQENQNISPCILGGCGCVHQEIAQEISQKHLKEVSLGYKKR